MHNHNCRLHLGLTGANYKIGVGYVSQTGPSYFCCAPLNSDCFIFWDYCRVYVSV
jgi:hypothetical protein